MSSGEASSELKVLVSYVPSLVAQRLENEEVVSNSPLSERQQGAILFADVSGFTALTERLAADDPAGAETLSRLLNIYFSQLLTHIASFDGDVVKFAGDAVLAFWQADDNDPSTAIRRAAECSLDIQRTLHNYEVEAGSHLSVRLSIGSGEIIIAHLGGVHGRWEYLLAGSPLEQLGMSMKQVHPGEVILSPEARIAIKEMVVGQDLEDGYFRLEKVLAPPLPPASRAKETSLATLHALRAYVPAAILARLEAGQSNWLAELRRVTVLFLNLPDLGHEVTLERAQRIMVTLQNALYRYEGSVNKLSVDDKGATLVAVLGLPPFGHENDPIRGVEAALAMQTALKALDLHCAIGITTGRVFCGTIGNDWRREYTIIGDSVNLAARLMQAAPDDILCDDTTYEAVQHQFAFDTLPPISVKGKADQIPVYRPQHRKKSDTRPKHSMIGRSVEQGRLRAYLQRLLNENTCNTVFIEGEAGIGKSRLMSDFVEHAQSLDLKVVLGAGDAIERSSPYHAWRPIFNQFFNLGSMSEPSESQLTRIRTRFATMPELGKFLPLLNAVLPLELPDNDLTSQMTGQVRADNIRFLLISLLKKLVIASPLIVILEDVHWLDSASWNLVTAVTREVSSVLLVLTSRPVKDDIPAEYRQWLASSNIEHLALSPLATDETTILVKQALGVTTLPESVSTFIQEKAEGHPFFSEQLAYALRDSDMLLIEGSECRLAQGADDFHKLSFPDTVEGVVTSRIDRLIPSQQLLLKVASVVGRIFAFRILRDIFPLEANKSQLPGDLLTLERLDITELEEEEPDLAYIFKHVITHEVAYNLLPVTQRRELHKSVAAWYESSYSHDMSPYYAVLAYHWERAENFLKGVYYLDKAGEQALRNGNYQEAVTFFTNALSLYERNKLGNDRLPQGIRERQLGEAYLGLGDLEKGGSHLRQALTIVDYAEPTQKMPLVINLLRQVAIQFYHRVFPSAFVRASRSPDISLREATRAYWQLWDIYLFTGEKLPLLNSFLYTVNLAERAGLTDEMAQAYASMSLACGLIPLHSLARMYSRLAREKIQTTNDLQGMIRVSLIVGLYQAGTGEWEKADIAFSQAIILSKNLGDWRRWEEASAILGVIAILRGVLQGNVQLGKEIYNAARQNNHVQAQQWGLGTQYVTMRMLGKLDDALSIALTTVPLIVNSDQLGQINVYGELSAIYLDLGKEAEAVQAAHMALHAMVQSQPTTFNTTFGTSSTAMTFLRLWEKGGKELKLDLDTLKANARNSCKILEQLAHVFPIAEPRAWRLKGLYDWLDGRQTEAQKAWTKALEFSKKMAMPYDEALAHYEIGRHLAVSNPKRSPHLRSAREIFDRLGVAYDYDLLKETD